MDTEVTIKYSDLVSAREQFKRELIEEINGLPLTVDHYRLIEDRMQTAILAGCLVDVYVPEDL